MKVAAPQKITFPGQEYLCQVGNRMSCGACCGLYNVSDVSREYLSQLLWYRTQAFADVARDMDAILDFRRHIEQKEDPKRPYPLFHHCPYIGFIDEDQKLVGCLLHPMGRGNHGIDFRGLSYYGGLACNVYFCPSYRKLSSLLQQLLKVCLDDWFLYGLILTENKLLTAFNAAIEQRLKRPLQLSDLHHPTFIKAFQDLTRLKITWPFRSPEARNLAGYFFEDQLYVKPPVVYPETTKPPAPLMDSIFKALNSRFTSLRAYRDGHRMIDEHIENAASALIFSAPKRHAAIE